MTRPSAPWALRLAPAAVLVLSIAQLAVAQWVPGIERFADKAFGARLVLYPVLMLLAPVVWWALVGRRRPDVAVPYGAFTLVMAGFLVDTTGNSLDLYDSLTWWDDLNHLVNWWLLLTGLGLLLGPAVRPRAAVPWLVAGLGALLALGWELGEWFTFIRHGTELAEAYDDTLGDEALGTLGALAAGLLVHAVLARRDAARPPAQRPAPLASQPQARRRDTPALFATLLAVTLGLLVLQVLTPGGFGDPAAAYRLLAYPLVALALPVGWWLRARRLPGRGGAPWVPATLVVLPLLLDTVGNVAGLYGRVSWWDDASHLGHWLLVGTAVAVLAAPVVRPSWALVVLVAGLGAALAVAWELFERAAYYRGTTDTAAVYVDMLADQTLGTLGALLAALLVVATRRATRRRR